MVATTPSNGGSHSPKAVRCPMCRSADVRIKACMLSLGMLAIDAHDGNITTIQMPGAPYEDQPRAIIVELECRHEHVFNLTIMMIDSRTSQTIEPSKRPAEVL